VWPYNSTTVVDGAAILDDLGISCDVWLAMDAASQHAALSGYLGASATVGQLNAALHAVNTYAGYACHTVSPRVTASSGALQMPNVADAGLRAGGAAILGELGLSCDQWNALSPQDRITRLDDISRRMHSAMLAMAVNAYCANPIK
jgi:hypothetical protein